MTTDTLGPTGDIIYNWNGSQDSMHWSPPDPHPLAVERRENPGMAAIREHAHTTGMDGHAAAADIWDMNLRRLNAALRETQRQIQETLAPAIAALPAVGAAFQRMFTDLKTAADLYLGPKPHGRARRYRNEMRQLKRRNR